MLSLCAAISRIKDAGCPRTRRGIAQDARERVAVSPDKKDQQDRYDAGHWQTAGVHQDVNEVDVHNDGSEQNQTERHEASDKQEQSPDDLEYADDMKVTGHEKRLGEVAGRPRRRWRHRNKVQEDVRTEDNEDQSEKNASNNGGDFHSPMVT